MLFRSFSEGLAWVAKEDADGNWKWGCIDKTGAVMVPLEYDGYDGYAHSDAEIFPDGLAMVVKKDADGNWKWGGIDKTGAVVVPLEYDFAGYLSSGMLLQ